MGVSDRTANHPVERMVERPPKRQDVLDGALGVGTPLPEPRDVLHQALDAWATGGHDRRETFWSERQ